MIAITKEEKDTIQAMFPKVPIARTSKKKSSRHRYYMAEETTVVNFLKAMRSSVENFRKEGIQPD